MSIIQAIFLGGWEFLAYATFRGEFMEALPTALIAGLILGDVPTALAVGAVIQMMYIAYAGAGGNMPNDKVAATLVCCSVAISGGVGVEQSIALAVPVALLCGQMVTWINALNSIWVPYADRAAREGNARQISMCALVYPNLVKIVVLWVPMVIVLYAGTDMASALINALPDWVNRGLAVMSGLLPALGIAILTNIVGHKKIMPFFFAGYFLMAFTGMSTIALTMCGLFVAFLYYLIVDNNKGDEAVETVEVEDVPQIDASVISGNLSYGEITRIWCRWYWAQEQSLNYERMQAIAFCHAIAPRLKKLYANDEHEYRLALQRHLEFYNTECVWGSVLNGVVLALEEEHAAGGLEDTTVITNVKASMMGTFAALGDTLGMGTFAPLLLAAMAQYASKGFWWAGLGYSVIYFTYRIIVGTLFLKTGYTLGLKAATTMFTNGVIHVISTCAGVLGLFMIGGIGASFVNVTTPITIQTAGNPIVLQTLFDNICPGLFSLAAILGVYFYIKRDKPAWKALLILVAIGFVLGAVGIIG